MKLSEVLAVEKKARVLTKKEITGHYQAVQRSNSFSGFTKTFQANQEDGVTFAPERQVVQKTVTGVLADVAAGTADLLNLVAQKDFANCEARADVSVGGTVVLTGVPATHLLYLEKHLTELVNIVQKLPVLDPAEEWTLDETTGRYRTEAFKTSKTKKVQRPLVMYPATPEHPAQTHMIVEDIKIGEWRTIKESGAIPELQKRALLARVRTLGDAVRVAREVANQVAAPRQDVGSKVKEFLFA